MSTRKRAVRLPEDWVIPETWISWARRQGMSEDDARREAEQMKDWSLSTTSGVKLDWFAAWRNWVRRAQERTKPRRVEENAFDRQLREMKEKADGKRH